MSREEKVNISLTRREYEVLLLMCGWATGTAIKQGDTKLADSFLALANTVNRNNPNWIPYEIPAEEEA